MVLNQNFIDVLFEIPLFLCFFSFNFYDPELKNSPDLFQSINKISTTVPGFLTC